MKKRKHPVEFFAELESEIAKYGVPPPKPHPWVVNSDGTTDMAARNLQMLEYLEDLRKRKGPK